MGRGLAATKKRQTTDYRKRMLDYLAMDPDDKIKFRVANRLTARDIFCWRSPQVEEPMSMRETERQLSISRRRLSKLHRHSITPSYQVDNTVYFPGDWLTAEIQRLDRSFSIGEVYAKIREYGLRISSGNFEAVFRSFHESLDNARPRFSFVATAKIFQQIRENKRKWEKWRKPAELAGQLGVGVNQIFLRLREGEWPGEQIHLFGSLSAREWRIPPEVFNRIVLEHKESLEVFQNWESAQELAARLGVSLDIVLRNIHNKRIPAREICALGVCNYRTFRIYPFFSDRVTRALKRGGNIELGEDYIFSTRERLDNRERLAQHLKAQDAGVQKRKEGIVKELIRMSKRDIDLKQKCKELLDLLPIVELEEGGRISFISAVQILGVRTETFRTRIRCGKIPGLQTADIVLGIPNDWINRYRRETHHCLDRETFFWACQEAGIRITRKTRIYRRSVFPHAIRDPRYIPTRQGLYVPFSIFVDLLEQNRAEGAKRKGGLLIKEVAARVGRHESTISHIVTRHNIQRKPVLTDKGIPGVLIPYSEARKIIMGLKEERFSIAKAAEKLGKGELGRRDLTIGIRKARKRLGVGHRNFRGRWIIPPENYREIFRLVRRWERHRDERVTVKVERDRFNLLVDRFEFLRTEIRHLTSLTYAEATDGEMERLMILAKQGNNKAFEVIANEFMRFIRYMGGRYYGNIPMDDKIQFGLLGVLQAVSQWHPLPDAIKKKTSAYIRKYIRGAILRYCKSELLPRGRIPFALRQAMELEPDLPGRTSEIEMFDGITFTPARK